MNTDTVVTLATSRVNSLIPSLKFCAGGARQLLAQAVETEVAELLAADGLLNYAFDKFETALTAWLCQEKLVT